MADNKHTMTELYQWQALPLKVKILMTKRRIRDWVNGFGESGVYVSFSGGKDSTVLLHIARELYPNIKAVYVDTGLEYPEIRSFVKIFDNVDWVRPKKHFKQVCGEYGFPIISKEVSECVYGARKYLKSILTEAQANESVLTDRQTDRPWKYAYERITGTGAYQKSQNRNTSPIPIRNEQDSWNMQTRYLLANPQGGGYDNKYRKFRGIGEYSKQVDGKQGRRQQPEISNHVRNAHERQEPSDKGEYP